MQQQNPQGSSLLLQRLRKQQQTSELQPKAGELTLRDAQMQLWAMQAHVAQVEQSKQADLDKALSDLFLELMAVVQCDGLEGMERLYETRFGHRNAIPIIPSVTSTPTTTIIMKNSRRVDVDDAPPPPHSFTAVMDVTNSRSTQRVDIGMGDGSNRNTNRSKRVYVALGEDAEEEDKEEVSVVYHSLLEELKRRHRH